MWIAVPPEYRTWGAPPAIEFVDAMMRFIGADYYIGWLSAAALHGSAHHAPQITQIATSRPVRDRVVGRNRLNFNTRSNIINLPTCEKTVRSGAVRISTPEVTAMDLCSDLVLGAGIDNVATVIEGLAAEGVLSVKNILSIAQFYSPAVLRRLGWILENFTNIPDIDLLAKAAASLSASPSVLDYLRKREGTIDSRWSLLVNAGVESEY
ncbi:MAG: type IV toxin-antitoxin system AbiEi family antitoxin [Coriobacteriales bacterium]|nr:type IV toxin-antitoxin system AbiEi family antitoxin [Coriobacteriales bacterium]